MMCESIARNPICFTCSHSKTPWRLFSIHAVLFATQNKYVANIFAYRTKSSLNRRQMDMDMDGKEKLHDKHWRNAFSFRAFMFAFSLLLSGARSMPGKWVYLFCKSKRLKTTTTTTKEVKSTHIFPHSSQTSPGTDKRRRKGLEKIQRMNDGTHTTKKRFHYRNCFYRRFSNFLFRL